MNKSTYILIGVAKGINFKTKTRHKVIVVLTTPNDA